MDRYMREHKYAWARLNSDTMFIGLLAMGTAVFDLLDPARDAPLVAFGYVDTPTPLFYLKCGGYLLGGFSLLYALIRPNISLEVVSRIILIATALVDWLRNVIAFGFESKNALALLVLVLIISFTSILRVTALFNKNGLVFRLPPTELRRIDDKTS